MEGEENGLGPREAVDGLQFCSEVGLLDSTVILGLLGRKGCRLWFGD